MGREALGRARREMVRLTRAGLDWVSFSVEATEVLRRAIPFERSCWHLVDPGTVLFTGIVSQHVHCSGTWLAQFEYAVEDVNQWWSLAQSGQLAGATSIATGGELSRSPRHRSVEGYGIGDELRGSFVADRAYWGAAGFMRASDGPHFTEEEVSFLASLSGPIAQALRRAVLVVWVKGGDAAGDEGPGVVVFDAEGRLESISPAAERWLSQVIEIPPPQTPADSKVVRLIAARAAAMPAGQDPLYSGARSRVQARSGRWLQLYGTRLSGAGEGRTAVIVQPAAAHEVAPLVALAYGLTDREGQVTRLCMRGLSTKEIAHALGVSPYTVQDHLKSIFDKTGVRSRGELVGQVFLEHYAPRWEDMPDPQKGWSAKATPAASAPVPSDVAAVAQRRALG